jgi:hypothetical protein
LGRRRARLDDAMIARKPKALKKKKRSRVLYRYCPACRIRTACFENEHTDIDCSTVRKLDEEIRELTKSEKRLVDNALDLVAQRDALQERIDELLRTNTAEVERRRLIERDLLVQETIVAALADRCIIVEAKLKRS